jgi:hypothetical protein
MLKASRRLGPVAWLLCVLLISASLDQVADPPAVTSHGSEIKSLCSPHLLESAADHVFVGHSFVSLLPQPGPMWLIPAQLSRPEMPNTRATVVRHAADPSPPRLFSLFALNA